MHEYPITQRIIELACAKAAEQGVSRIRCVHLVLGEDAGYVGETIRLYFGLIAADTACEQAELAIRSIKPQLQCPQCGTLFIRKPFSFECPSCQTLGHPTSIGKECYVEAIEVEPNRQQKDDLEEC